MSHYRVEDLNVFTVLLARYRPTSIYRISGLDIAYARFDAREGIEGPIGIVRGDPK